MKTKTTMIVILLFSFSAFGKSEKLSDLGKLGNPFLKMSVLQKAIDADAVARVFDAPPSNDYEEFKSKLAPDAGALISRLNKSEKRTGLKNKKKTKKLRPRLMDFSIFGSDKKEL